MKKTLAFILAYGLLVGTIIAVDLTGTVPQDRVIIDGVTIETQQYGYLNARAAAGVSADDTPLATTTKSWDAIKSTFLRIPRNWSVVKIEFYCYGDGTGVGDPDGGTFDCNIYLAWLGGGANMIWTGDTLTAGKVQLSSNPVTFADFEADTVPDPNYVWVDTIPAGTPTHVTTVYITAGGGSDNISSIMFDPLGAYGIFVEIDTRSSITTIFPVITGVGG